MKRNLFLLIAVLAMAACGRVGPGEVGVKVSQFGTGAGVQSVPLTTGTHALSFGESIISFPTNTLTEKWTGEQGSGGNPISFASSEGVEIRAPISLQFRVDPSKAPNLVKTYRLGINDIVDGPVRTKIQGAFNILGQQYTAEQLTTGSVNKLLMEVTTQARNELAKEGIIVENISLVSKVLVPQGTQDRIDKKVEAQQDAQTAVAQLEVTKAQAAQRIEEARGRAEAMKIEGDAIRANPEVLKNKELDRWTGECPINASTCVIGGQALVNSK